MLKQLLPAALGLKPLPSIDWELVNGPASELLPLLAWRLGAEAPPRLKGLLRHTWSRYQWLLDEARQICSLTQHPLLLIDDLALAGRWYPSPSARSLHGLDLLVPRSALPELAAQLEEKGWQRPAWSSPPEYSEWRSKRGVRLRLHWDWLPDTPQHQIHQVWSCALDHEGMRVPSAQDQFWRCCWTGPEPLWLVDAWLLLNSEGSDGWQVPPALNPLLRRWSQIFRHRLGVSVRLPQPRNQPGRSLADQVLALSHRRSGRGSRLLEELARDLRRADLPGYPTEWLRALCQRWKLRSLSQLPGECVRRWRAT